MSSEEKRTYEGMFLLDTGKGDFQTASEPVVNVLNRSEAEVLTIKPWDERKLRFQIEGRKRGLYVLTYFKADPSVITEIEHDCQLSDDELAERRKHWKMPEPRYKSGYLAKYASMATSADSGALLKWD